MSVEENDLNNSAENDLRSEDNNDQNSSPSLEFDVIVPTQPQVYVVDSSDNESVEETSPSKRPRMDELNRNYDPFCVQNNNESRLIDALGGITRGLFRLASSQEKMIAALKDVSTKLSSISRNLNAVVQNGRGGNNSAGELEDPIHKSTQSEKTKVSSESSQTISTGHNGSTDLTDKSSEEEQGSNTSEEKQSKRNSKSPRKKPGTPQKSTPSRAQRGQKRNQK